MIGAPPGATAQVWRKRRILWPFYFAAFTLVLGVVLQLTYFNDFWDGTEVPEYPWWIGGPILGVFTVPVTLPLLLVGRAIWLWQVRRRERAGRVDENAVRDRNL